MNDSDKLPWIISILAGLGLTSMAIYGLTRMSIRSPYDRVHTRRLRPNVVARRPGSITFDEDDEDEENSEANREETSRN